MKRLVAAAVLAVIVAGVGSYVVLPSECYGLTPGTFLYWLMGCEKDASGGGGGGAS